MPDAAELVGLDLAELCSWASELASQTGAAPRAHELGRRAIELVGDADPHRSALLHVRLGEYLYETGSNDAGFAAVERAVELVPAEPPSPERAYSLGSLAGVLMVAWRHAESLPIAEQALALARRVGAPEAEVRALTVLGVDLAHLGRAEEGLAQIRPTLQLAEEVGDRVGLERAYGNFTDVLTRLGRPRESARLGQEGLEAIRRYGITSTLLTCNQIEALLAVGDWDEADRLSAAALRGIAASSRSSLLTIRAEVEIGRGEFEAARAHLEAAGADLFEYRMLGLYDCYRAELALWERRWTDAAAAIDEGLARARQHEAAQIRVQLCATALRAQAELAALARARRNGDALRGWLDRARELIGIARGAAADAAPITPNAAGWLALAEAEYERADGVARPESWSEAAAAWEHLERPPLAAYCRWRQAEALVAAGAPRAEASVPLREASAVAARIGAQPLLNELELLAERARLDLTPPEADPHHATQGLEEPLGLTPREAEVLTLVARGLTNREIAATLVISVKTAGVHVSHILRKLNAPNRVEAAAIAHRLLPPHGGRRELELTRAESRLRSGAETTTLSVAWSSNSIAPPSPLSQIRRVWAAVADPRGTVLLETGWATGPRRSASSLATRDAPQGGLPRTGTGGGRTSRQRVPLLLRLSGRRLLAGGRLFGRKLHLQCLDLFDLGAELRMRDLALLDELDRRAAEVVVGPRECLPRLEVLDPLARLLHHDARGVLQPVEERLLRFAAFHTAILARGGRLAHLVDRGLRALVDRAPALLDARGLRGLGLGLGRRRRFLGARLRELLLQLIGRVGLGRRGLRLPPPAKEPGEHRRQPYPREETAHGEAMLLFRGLLASSRADPFPVALAHEADSDRGKEQ